MILDLSFEPGMLDTCQPADDPSPWSWEALPLYLERLEGETKACRGPGCPSVRNSCFTHVLNGTYIATPVVHSHGCRNLNVDISGHEDYFMYSTRRYLSSLLLAAGLLASAASIAKAGNQDDRRYDNDHVRYFDRDHRDYHNWDDREDRAYRRYLVAKHRAYRKFNRTSARVHRDYWNWRHDNPDRD